MRIDVLYFEGCPSYEALMPRLYKLLEESGFGKEDIGFHCVESENEADAQRFLGSPSVRVNGADVDPTAAGRVDFGMKCRIYRLRGEQTHTPPDEWIRVALRAAGES